MLQRLQMPKLLTSLNPEVRQRIVALPIARVVAAQSKLPTRRWWQTTSLIRAPAVAEASVDDLYAAMDALLGCQPAIERALAKRHLREGGIVLYDRSSSYVEGTHCPLAERGYNRDGKAGKKQVNYGLVIGVFQKPGDGLTHTMLPRGADLISPETQTSSHLPDRRAADCARRAQNRLSRHYLQGRRVARSPIYRSRAADDAQSVSRSSVPEAEGLAGGRPPKSRSLRLGLTYPNEIRRA